MAFTHTWEWSGYVFGQPGNMCGRKGRASSYDRAKAAMAHDITLANNCNAGTLTVIERKIQAI